DAVVIRIDPKSQLGIDGIPRIDYAITVTAIHWIVENCQCVIAVRVVVGGLWRHIAKELREVVYCPVTIAVERQPPISISLIRPTHLQKWTIWRDSELHSVTHVRDVKTFVECIYHNRAAGIATGREPTSGILFTVRRLARAGTYCLVHADVTAPLTTRGRRRSAT